LIINYRLLGNERKEIEGAGGVWSDSGREDWVGVAIGAEVGGRSGIV